MVESCTSCGGALGVGGDLPPCLCELTPLEAPPSTELPQAKGGTEVEARALRCPVCGGWLEATMRRCNYCSVQLAAVRCWRCFELSFAGSSHCGGCGIALSLEGDLGETDERCPVCKGEKLHLVDVGDHRIRECMACGGVLVDHETLERLTHAREVEAGIRVLEGSVKKAELIDIAVRYRYCGACGVILTRRNFGGSSGVIVDVCKEHGVWFDASELTSVLQFVASGGLRKEREQKQSDAKRELTRRRSEALAEQAKMAGTYGTKDAFTVDSAGALLNAIVEIFTR